MASGDYVIPGAQSVSEWFSPVQGFIEGCGQAAELVIAGIANGKPPTTSQVTQAIQQGIQNRQAGVHGSTTPSNIQWLAKQQGINLSIGSGSTALATIESNLQKGLPTELGVNNARAFGGANANVAGHYVTVVGKAANGNYIVADPNTKQATSGGFIQYTPKQLELANPFATLTPTNLPTPKIGAPVSGVGQAAASTAQNAFQGVLSAFGGVTAQDFAWRSGLIVGGFVLVVVGILVFFSREGETIVTSGAKVAAKVAAS